MKTLLAMLVALFAFAMPVRAASISVVNVSNQTLPCGPNSLFAILGHCQRYGPGTLEVSITTAPGEFPLACQQTTCSPGYDTYIVILYRGDRFTLDGRSSRMVPLSGDINTMAPTYPWGPSFYAQLTGKIPYFDRYDIQPFWGVEGDALRAMPLDGMEIYLGISPIGQHTFNATTFRQIWPLRTVAKPTTNG
ncbi:MAG: hypothetical protein JO142_11540 [Burkholderiales bacterium]|nr:hypothetical protein [Burkholderiales bacterium]